MKNLSIFQIVLLSISGAIIIVAVIIFSVVQGTFNKESGTVVVWGSIPEDQFIGLINYLVDDKEIDQKVEYKYIEPEKFDSEFTTALAENSGPDVALISESSFMRHKNKLLKIDYDFFSERNYKDTFVEAGEIFRDEKGIYAFPFVIDPMVMYWNRSSFTEKGKSRPPRYWDELNALVPQLVEKDSNLVLEKNAVALGEYQNINHAKEILMTLFMQTGNKIIVRSPLEGNITEDEKEDPSKFYTVIFDENLGFSSIPTEAAINFYTQFANPSRSVYTWNRSIESSLDSFITGDNAIYFGFASEFETVRQKNPNLNFDVAVMPQSRNEMTVPVTYGKVLALAIPKNSQNVETSYPFVQTLIQPDVIFIISDILFLPPVRRDLLSGDPQNAFMQTFHDSAILANNVYDFNPEETENIFQRMIESVVTGRLLTSEAVKRADGEIELLLE
jgi:ABC-type glycerol-3-phosphate transport system substrate-binding protein